MTQREVDRAGVVAEVVAGRMRQRRAAEALGVSTRQVKRLVRTYRLEGAGKAALQAPWAARASPVLRGAAGAVLALAADRYAGFGPTLVSEYLARERGIRLSSETLRQWMIGAGLWKTRAQRTPIHRARSRRPRFGELIQIDGSPHDWFEGRGPRCTMLVFIDDATSLVTYARLVPVECTQAYLDGLRAHLLCYGKPLAFYSDRHLIFRVNRRDGVAEPTQVGRALRALDIELICAHSPPAKGRVERVHQTFQDRFVKALRLAGVSTLGAANALLEPFLLAHNQRFAKPPCSAEDAHRPVALSQADLYRVLCPHHTRVVDRRGAVHFNHRTLQIAPSHYRRTLGKRLTVVVCDDHTELWAGTTPIPFTPFDPHTWRAEVLDRKTLDARLDQRTEHPRVHRPTSPPPDHPWRKSFLNPRL